MKKLFALLLAVVLLLSCVSCGEKKEEGGADTQENNELLAPDFNVYDGDANKVSLSDFRGKPVVLNFWATWCPPCKAEMPHFDEAYAEHGSDVEFMMVNLTDGSRDTVDSVKAFIAENEYTFPVYFDTTYSASNAYSVTSIPATVFINADGTVFATASGSLSKEILDKYMDGLIENNK